MATLDHPFATEGQTVLLESRLETDRHFTAA